VADAGEAEEEAGGLAALEDAAGPGAQGLAVLLDADEADLFGEEAPRGWSAVAERAAARGTRVEKGPLAGGHVKRARAGLARASTVLSFSSARPRDDPGS
jgi:hypothetical protein